MEAALARASALVLGQELDLASAQGSVWVMEMVVEAARALARALALVLGQELGLTSAQRSDWVMGLVLEAALAGALALVLGQELDLASDWECQMVAIRDGRKTMSHSSSGKPVGCGKTPTVA